MISNFYRIHGPGIKLHNKCYNSSQQCSKKRNFFDAPNSNFPLLNWLDIIVHRIESICTDRPMSRLHISVLENWHVQLLYRPIYYLHTSSAKIHKGMEIKLCISHWFVWKCWTMIFFQLFWWSPCALDFWVFVMSHMT